MVIFDILESDRIIPIPTCSVFLSQWVGKIYSRTKETAKPEGAEMEALLPRYSQCRWGELGLWPFSMSLFIEYSPLPTLPSLPPSLFSCGAQAVSCSNDSALLEQALALRLCFALVTPLKEAAFDSSWVQDDSVLYADTTVHLLPPTRHRLTNNLLYKLKVPPMNLSKWAADIWAHGRFKAMPEEPDGRMTQHARLS